MLWLRWMFVIVGTNTNTKHLTPGVRFGRCQREIAIAAWQARHTAAAPWIRQAIAGSGDRVI